MLTGDTASGIVSSHTVIKTQQHNKKMRTKTILLAMAALAAGLATSQAQTPVYSANIVGYVNLPLTPGQYSLYSPALDADGTGTNGTITTVVGTNVAVGTTVLVFNGTGYDGLLYGPLVRNGSPVWQLNGVADTNYPLNVGEGFWIQDPTDTNLTEAGTVMQGTLTNKYILPGGDYSLLASQVPLSGDITTNLNYIPTTGDTLLIYNGTGYNGYLYGPLVRNGPSVWQLNGVAAEPQISVGQGFWLQPAATTNWVETFTAH
jgi:hypothetical protein